MQEVTVAGVCPAAKNKGRRPRKQQQKDAARREHHAAAADLALYAEIQQQRRQHRVDQQNCLHLRTLAQQLQEGGNLLLKIDIEQEQQQREQQRLGAERLFPGR